MRNQTHNQMYTHTHTYACNAIPFAKISTKNSHILFYNFNAAVVVATAATSMHLPLQYVLIQNLFAFLASHSNFLSVISTGSTFDPAWSALKQHSCNMQITQINSVLNYRCYFCFPAHSMPPKAKRQHKKREL